ncbi:MAG TPA: hypothetical protein PKV16_07450 [Caldisericia bacterium]|nr:hypothetical protein [Caldisericia bacterium]HPI84366.1 hypothetical protein [Caldisericia bacterium]HPQ93602.1 hypothetical protein [Caldisericia bacterium]
MNWLYMTNLVMTLLVFIAGLFSWSKTKEIMYLLVGIAFLLFSVSHLFMVIDSVNELAWLGTTGFKVFETTIRIIAYLLCLWAVLSFKRK